MYIIDNVLTTEERTHYLLNQVNWSNPPVYVKPLMINEDMFVLGSSKIYNSDKELFVPIGKEKDTYDKWVNKLKNKFINIKDKFLVSSKAGKLNFNIDEKSKDKLIVAKRTNSIANRACTNYDIETYNMLLKWLTNESRFPEGVGAKPSRCFYLDLVTRKAVLNNKDGIYWITPEEFEILLEDDNRADLLKRIK